MIRAVQWATGQAGQLAVRAMLGDDRFKLVGAPDVVTHLDLLGYR